MFANNSPLRILHVFGALDCGGAETLIMNVYRQLDRSAIQFDFAVDVDRPCYYDAEIAQLGGRIFRLPHPEQSGIRAYGQGLAYVLRAQGPFGAVHSHVQHFGGFVMRVAAQARVPVRVAHSHNTSDDRPKSWKRALYRQTMERLIRRHATHMLGCSRTACAALFGKVCWRDSRVGVLPNAINLERYAACQTDRAALRRQLGVPDDARLLLHVGRFNAQKNHQQLLDIFAALLRKLPDAQLALVGDGPLRPEIEAQICSLGIERAVHLLGVRDDVPALMGAADAFVFPSLYEGLGMVVVEAQAAGLPCIVADSVPAEADLHLGMLRSVALDAYHDVWVAQILAALPTRVRGWDVRKQALEGAGYDIQRMAKRLERIYGVENREPRTGGTAPQMNVWSDTQNTLKRGDDNVF